MSCWMSKMLSYLTAKSIGKMTDRGAKAWAEKEAFEEDLKRERAKVQWLCRQLESRDVDTPLPRYHRSASAWEELATLYGIGGAECTKKTQPFPLANIQAPTAGSLW